jgi:ABC-2 type transport system ATP-binding protein
VSPNLVETTGLGMRFGKANAPALNSLTVGIPAGGITCVVGPDGAGKTTFIRILAGLIEPTQGSARILGLDPVRESDQLHARIGYMPQKFGLYEDLDVHENMRLYAEVRGLPRSLRDDTFKQLLHFTGMERFTERLAGRLSGGMKQKLALACAMIKQPELLLLDEPSVGVDPISRRELWRLARNLSGQGIGVVWSTAYLDEAEGCDKVLLLNEGRLLFSGKPQELTGRVRGRVFQVREIEGNRRTILRRALAVSGVIDGVIQGRYVRLVLANGMLPPDPKILHAGPKATMVAVEPRFEDAFIDILGGGPGGVSALAEHMQAKPSSSKSSIEAVGLTKVFGDFIAAKNITFSIRQSEIFGLLGPNGAGKSTTFKMMCGLLKPTSGQALVDGLSLAKAPGKARARIGYMAQKFSLYGVLSVQQNLQFFSGVYGLSGKQRQEAVDGMIDIFALKPYLDVSADELPLGFKQRLALACAVMHEPSVLFLDEPTSGVDPITRREFWTHINGMVEKGVTVMVTTHFMDEAEYCDRIGLVYKGRIIAIDTPDNLKASMASQVLPDPTLDDAFVSLVAKSDEDSDPEAKTAKATVAA